MRSYTPGDNELKCRSGIRRRRISGIQKEPAFSWIADLSFASSGMTVTVLATCLIHSSMPWVCLSHPSRSRITLAIEGQYALRGHIGDEELQSLVTGQYVAEAVDQIKRLWFGLLSYFGTKEIVEGYVGVEEVDLLESDIDSVFYAFIGGSLERIAIEKKKIIRWLV
jgi:hypothetical protein